VHGFCAVEAEDADGPFAEFHRDGELADEALFNSGVLEGHPVVAAHIVDDDGLASEGVPDDGVVFCNDALISVFLAEAEGASHFEVAGLLIEEANGAGLDAGDFNGGLGKLVEHLLKGKASGNEVSYLKNLFISIKLLLRIFRHKNIHTTVFVSKPKSDKAVYNRQDYTLKNANSEH
jgi:hypothetical protein